MKKIKKIILNIKQGLKKGKKIINRNIIFLTII